VLTTSQLLRTLPAIAGKSETADVLRGTSHLRQIRRPISTEARRPRRTMPMTSDTRPQQAAGVALTIHCGGGVPSQQSLKCRVTAPCAGTSASPHTAPARLTATPTATPSRSTAGYSRTEARSSSRHWRGDDTSATVSSWSRQAQPWSSLTRIAARRGADLSGSWTAARLLLPSWRSGTAPQSSRRCP
jgi:hypothetical protein